MTDTKKQAVPTLPDGIQESDLKRRQGPVGWKAYQAWLKKPENKRVTEFELWYCTGMGWVIPTLLIRQTRRADRASRTYAISLKGDPCRVGMGPHVIRQITVHVTEATQERLQKYLDLKLKGEQESNQIRDRISSRRAMTAMARRSIFGF